MHLLHLVSSIQVGCADAEMYAKLNNQHLLACSSLVPTIATYLFDSAVSIPQRMCSRVARLLILTQSLQSVEIVIFGKPYPYHTTDTATTDPCLTISCALTMPEAFWRWWLCPEFKCHGLRGFLGTQNVGAMAGGVLDRNSGLVLVCLLFLQCRRKQIGTQ